MACSSLLPGVAGILPSAFGRPVFHSRPMPYTSLAVPDRVSGLRLVRPWLMKAVLQDTMKSCWSVLFGKAPGKSFGIATALLLFSGQATTVSGLIPVSSRAVEVTIFIVEPGASRPVKARFWPAAGALAKASTWPVLGSIATIEPCLPPRSVIAFSAAAWMVLSSVTLNGLPGFGSTMVNSLSEAALPAGSLITTALPESWSLFGSGGSSFWAFSCRVFISAGVSEAPCSTLPLRSTTVDGGAKTCWVAMVSLPDRCGWITDGAQCTAGVLSLIFTTPRKPW